MTEKYLIFKKGVILLVGISFCILGIYLTKVRVDLFEYTSVDLEQDYYAAKHLMDQESIYSDMEHINNHPPLTAFLLAPISFLPYMDVGIIWTILSIILYFLTWWMIMRELNIHLPLEYLLVFIGFSLCWHPFHIHIGLGQWSILIGSCIAICWICLRHDRDLLAGIVLGLACLIKFYPGLLIIYLLFTKRWKALLATVSVVLVGTLLLGFILGPDQIIYYFTTVVSRDTNIYSTFPQNFSLSGILGKFLTNGNWVKPILVSPIPIHWLTLILDIGVLIILIKMMFRFPNDQDHKDIAFSLIIISMIFLSPVSWQHSLTIITIPICLILMKILNKNFNIKYGYGLTIFALILLSLPDIQIDGLLLSINAPDRLPWYLGLGFLFYDVGLLILSWILIQSGKIEVANASTG
jgi:hypothetical protein